MSDPPGPALWATDTGTLPDPVRRVIVALLKGPYLSRRRHEKMWDQLIASEQAIRSRLADCYAELIVDDGAELAYLRNAPCPDAPSIIRSHTLTFVQTAMVLALRRTMLTGDAGDRALVDFGEVLDQLDVYRAGVDQAAFTRRVRTAWTRMRDLGILLKTSTEDRCEISSALKILIDAETIGEIEAEYQAIAQGKRAPGGVDDDGDVDDGEEEPG